MQELLGRLQTLDPQAGAELRIVAHFDVLVASHVGPEALLRAAVTLAGCPAGYADRRTVIIIDGAGHRRTDGGPVGLRRSVPGRAGACVWLDRAGEPQPTDEMIIERLALAVSVTEQRRLELQQPLLVLIDPDASEEDRRAAGARLRLSGRNDLRMVALAEHDPLPDGVTGVSVAIGPDRWRAVLDLDQQHYRLAGLGVRGAVDELPTSWQTAVAARRLAGRLLPVVDAEDLGILTTLADHRADDAHDHGRGRHADHRRLAAVIEEVPWAAITVEALILTGSRRSAASVLGVHHATLQARVERLTTLLGYDITAPLGNHRLMVGYLSYRLA
ncbi:hypothetical protein GCM10011575_00970 [Microlunatus endophyticus]|uniref:PucR C-terminal helix-turn-helix domain-containing protein n=1 Tax=Microlunatus endophyticus TaxID=1716077 RepID=A0A917VZ16_9ACTN|nr:helix-turn-helix domain-containing protein [Microlunatus endophyticus]GGL46925.1 hypothetical protein GCM10011575_00970 [Microlunatus endophyticus]